MLSAFANAFRTPDLRRKLLFALLHHRAVPAGLAIPPRLWTSATCRRASTPVRTLGHLQPVNLFSGGALLQLSIFALGIMPYITASIILQLLAW